MSVPVVFIDVYIGEKLLKLSFWTDGIENFVSAGIFA